MADETYLSPLPSDMQSDELAEISGSGQHALPSRQFCVFRAGRERFCLPVLAVEEVVAWQLVPRVPLGPPFLMGVFNLRGTIIPAVDIAVTEGRRPGLQPRSIIVAVLAGDDQSEDMHVGVAADEVIGTLPAHSESRLDHAPRDMRHCRAMLRHEECLALVLDVRQLIQVLSVPVI